MIVDGYNTRDSSHRLRIRQQVGLLFSTRTTSWLPVLLKGCGLWSENLGLPAAEIRERVRWALSVVGMEEYLKYPPHMLSGGQKQRVAIAGVLALGPSYMVLDEPTSMLDPRGREEVVRTLTKLNLEQGTAIIMVTHFVEEAAAADRVVVLDRGRVLVTGSPLEVLTRIDDLADWGLEAPEIALLCHELRKRGYSHFPMALDSRQVVDTIKQFPFKD